MSNGLVLWVSLKGNCQNPKLLTGVVTSGHHRTGHLLIVWRMGASYRLIGNAHPRM